MSDLELLVKDLEREIKQTTEAYNSMQWWIENVWDWLDDETKDEIQDSIGLPPDCTCCWS